MDFNSIQTPTKEQFFAAEFFRLVLTEALEELLHQVDGKYKYDKVKQSIRKISDLYRRGLAHANSEFRSDWNDAANRCAYVFLYFTHHCYLVYFSLQQILPNISTSWQNKSRMRVCSIGGGPGSDLVGLTKFLQDTNLFPSSLQCLVLDLFPSWELTWDTIYQHLPETFQVIYEGCDLVRDAGLPSDVIDFIRDVDLLTLVKSFSAMSAFFRTNPNRRELLRSILNELKEGCFVLFIDNDHAAGDGFEQQFASPAGLDLLFQFSGHPVLPFGSYSDTIQNFRRNLDFSPMRSCDVIVRLFRKNRPMENNHVSNRQSRIDVNGAILDPVPHRRRRMYSDMNTPIRRPIQSSSLQRPTSQHRPSLGSAIQTSTSARQPSSSSSFQHPNIRTPSPSLTDGAHRVSHHGTAQTPAICDGVDNDSDSDVSDGDDNERDFEKEDGNGVIFKPVPQREAKTPIRQPIQSSSLQQPIAQHRPSLGSAIQNSTSASQPSSSSSFQHDGAHRVPNQGTAQTPAICDDSDSRGVSDGDDNKRVFKKEHGVNTVLIILTCVVIYRFISGSSKT